MIMQYYKRCRSCHSVSKSSVGCSKVCVNNFLRWNVQSGHRVAERGVKLLPAVICLLKWGALQLPILSPNILQCSQTYCAIILSFVYTSAPLMRCTVRMRRISGARLINFPQTLGEQRTPNAWGRIQFSLSLHKKLTNFGSQRAVCKLFADGAAQVCSPIQTYEHLVREPFGALVYTRL